MVLFRGIDQWLDPKPSVGKTPKWSPSHVVYMYIIEVYSISEKKKYILKKVWMAAKNAKNSILNTANIENLYSGYSTIEVFPIR